jgi:hypothetical protein
MKRSPAAGLSVLRFPFRELSPGIHYPVAAALPVAVQLVFG